MIGGPGRVSESTGARRASLGAGLIPLLGAVLLASGCAGTRGPDVAAPGPVPESRLQAELTEIFADPAFSHAHWGVMVQSVETGEILFRRNAEKLFMPASNMKLVTAAVALARLGPEHRFHTELAAHGAIADDGTLQGDLVVRGGGDPSISERFYDGDPTGAFEAWADSLEARGVRRITGDVVGDDDRFDDVHLGPGWAWDYLDSYYAAEIGALLFNEGAVTFKIRPGESAGVPARVEMVPSTGYLSVDARVTTVADSTEVDVVASREPFTNDVRIRGAIWAGQDSLIRYIAPHDPTLLFVTVLTETLEERGIVVEGGPVDVDDLAERLAPDSLTVLFTHASPTVAEIVKPFLKRSQNQIGEMLLRALGAAETDTGSVRNGRRVVEGMLADWGIPEEYFIYVDGSGLSRYNYLSPEALVRLLRVMAHRPEFEAFYDALPVAGIDGTLRRRMRGTLAEENARAKTGYISNARTLSGYVTTRDGERLAFSLMANNFQVPVGAVEYLQDLAVERLANFSRRDGGPQ